MNDNVNPWEATGQIGLLPYEARERLRRAAAVENPRDRRFAIEQADRWVRAMYPQFFNTIGDNNGY